MGYLFRDLVRNRLKYLFIMAFLLIFLVAPSVYAAQTANATLSWDSNTESDINKYILHMGIVSGIYGTTLDVPHTPGIPRQSGKFLNLTEGNTYFFVAQACDIAGNCSGFSNEVSKKVTIAPGIPGNLGISIEINVTLSLE